MESDKRGTEPKDEKEKMYKDFVESMGYTIGETQ